MIQHIMVPIDGSALSEGAIPLAESLARAQGAELALVRVIDDWAALGALYGDEAFYGDETGLTDPLDEVSRMLGEELVDLAASLTRRGVKSEAVTLHGRPARALLDYERERRPDLVVMATHGRTGAARFLLGSVADRLVREGVAPVLLVRGFGPVIDRVETALVALDGSALAETALPLVEELAGRPLQRVRLMRALGAGESRSQGRAYLEEVATRLAEHGLTSDLVLCDEPPALALLMESEQVDLVVIATHGRGGLNRLRHGSVAEYAVGHLAKPLLLVRSAVAQRVGAPAVAAALPTIY